MDTVIKAACFKDLQDGQIFTVRSVKWIKVNESDKYNAVKFFDSSKACTFSDNIVVNIEVELIPDDEDDEVTLRKTAKYGMLANVRFDNHSCDTERRQQYKSRADEVLLSRSYKNQAHEALKCDSPQSDESIFDMLTYCTP